MAKNILSFRISEHTETQLMELENLENENGTRYNLKVKSKAELIEEAIEFYYLQRMDAKKGHPYFNYFETQTKELFDRNLKELSSLWRDVHYQNIKNSELILLFLKLLDLDVSDEAINKVIDLNLYAEEKVDEKVAKIMKKNGEI